MVGALMSSFIRRKRFEAELIAVEVGTLLFGNNTKKKKGSFVRQSPSQALKGLGVKPP